MKKKMQLIVYVYLISSDFKFYGMKVPNKPKLHVLLAVSSGKSKGSKNVSHTSTSTPGSSSSSSDKGGGNSVCHRETPKWQKPITNFFVKSEHSEKNVDKVAENQLEKGVENENTENDQSLANTSQNKIGKKSASGDGSTTTDNSDNFDKKTEEINDEIKETVKIMDLSETTEETNESEGKRKLVDDETDKEDQLLKKFKPND